MGPGCIPQRPVFSRHTLYSSEVILGMFESQNGSINSSNTTIFATGNTCVGDQESCQVVYSAMASTESFQRFSRT